VNPNQSGSRPESRAFVALREVIQGGRPLIYISTSEELRVRQLLQEAAQRLFPAPVPVWSWTSTRGLVGPDGSTAAGEPLDAGAVLDFIARYEGAGIFQLCDFHDSMRGGSEIRRRLRDLYVACLDSGKFTVITSPLRIIPEELSRQIALIELLHPDLEEMIDFLTAEENALALQGHTVDRSTEATFKLGRALQGLTLDDARHALRRALAIEGKLDGDSTTLLLEE
jgi:hypothetical protein